MLKKTITFENLDGKMLTEDFYFHLTKAEAAEMELGKKGGLTEYLKKIVAEEDGEKLVAIFKDLLTKTVGRRSVDGRRFIKSQEIIDDFVQTDAYSELFVELATNAGQAAAFMNGIMPASMQDAVKKTSQTENAELPAADDAEQTSPGGAEDAIEEKFKDPFWMPSSRDLNRMTQDQLLRAFQRKETPSEITP